MTVLLFSSLPYSLSDQQLRLDDIMNSLGDQSGFSEVKKKLQRLEKTAAITTPLAKVEKERINRKAGYDHTSGK